MIVIKNNAHQLGNSLVIQCLRLELSLPRAQVQSLAWELRSHKLQGMAKNQLTNQNKTKKPPINCTTIQPSFHMVLEKTPESPLDSNEIKLVSLKGNQP